jgi:hypothetical protein
MWVKESVNQSVVKMTRGNSGMLPTPSILLVFIAFTLAAINERKNE